MTESTIGLVALLEGGQDLQPQPDRPLGLLDTSDIFLVTAGRAMIFAQRCRDAVAVGERVHVATLHAGDLLPGMRCDAAPPGLLIEVATDPGTTLRRYVAPSLAATAVADAIDCWFMAMLPRTSHAYTSEATLLVADKRTSLAVDVVATADRLLWVEAAAGLAVKVNGSPLATCAGLLPVCPGIRLIAGEAIEIEPRDTAALFSAGQAEAVLASAITVLLAAIDGRCEGALQEFTIQVRRRQTMEAAAQGAVLEGLRRVIDVQTGGDETFTSGQPILDACRMVAAAAGIELPAHVTVDEGSWISPIDQVCRAGRFRSRAVVLAGQWWKQQSGPILGTTGQGHPVALIQRRGRYYAHIFDDQGAAKARRVDAGFADTLSDVASTFYRPLPQRPLRLRDVLRFAVHGSLTDFAVIVGLAIAVALINLVAPYAVGTLIDRVIPNASRNDLLVLVVVLATSAFSVSMLSLASSFAALRAQTRASYGILAALLDRLVSLPATFFRQFSAGDLCQRVMGVEQIRETLTQSTMATLLAGVSATGYLFLILHYSERFALLALGFAVLAVVVTGILGAIQVHFQHRIQHRLGRLDALLLQFFSGIEKIRVAAAERRMFTLWGLQFSDLWSNAFKAGVATNILSVFNGAYSIAATMGLYWVFVHHGSDSGGIPGAELSTGVFLAVYSAFSALLLSAASVGSAMMSSMLIIPIYKRLKPVIETVPEGTGTTAEVGPLRGDLRVEGITFRYGEDLPAVLEGVSIRAAHGEFVAIVGPSGSGKSTLLKILLGIETPQRGEVFYDGRSLTRLDVNSVRRQIGVVMQDTRIMPGFIRELLIGSANLTLDDAWAAVRLAGIEEEIRAMPMGMFTYISDTSISGGQRQRLLIARALVTRPRLLFFDEATSALDAESQAVVRDSIDSLGVTRIVIAHRLSTIIRADRIYVLDAGRIVQCGTYDELMAQEGRFRKLAERQLI